MIEFKKLPYLLPAVASIALTGCGAPEYEFDSDFHITKERASEEAPAPTESIPDLVGSTAELPELTYQGTGDTYTILVNEVSMRDVLNSLADQAQLNLDIEPTLDGLVTLNAYEQTIPQILERIQKQVSLRYEQIGETIAVVADSYYIKQYHLTYPGLTRSYSASADGSVPSSGEGSLGSSSISISKDASGSVWFDLEDALNALFNAITPTGKDGITIGSPSADDDHRAGLAEIQQRQPDNSSLAPFVYVLPDASLVIVHGTSQHHALADSVIREIGSSAVKQVLLQATVVEIALNNQYQQGIDWSIFDGDSKLNLLQSSSNTSGEVLGRVQTGAIEEYKEFLEIIYPENEDGDTNPIVTSLLLDLAGQDLHPRSAGATGGFLNATFRVDNLASAVTLLDTFGDTRVVSSPRISTLNGQGAILKVVTDLVYFTLETTREREDGITTESVSTTQNVIPVGFVVNVYPQIGDDGTIILAMRPSISRVTGYAQPPTVGSGGTESNSGVPIVSVKEIETLMLLQDGQTAVMGGLIEDQLLDKATGVPGVADLPALGNLFQNKDESTRRVEYVIFVSAKIITNPSIYGDYSDFRDLLPSDETFRRDKSNSLFTRGTADVPRSVE